MARYTDEQCRICRREGQKLFLKGSRCYSDKCSISRRNYAPGQHGQKRAKLSEYGTQLREKQKTKSYYGVGEKQFRGYFEMASNKKGVTGENLLQILESRLDNVVYRLGFGASRAQARQLVNHGQFEVNGKRVDIPVPNYKYDSGRSTLFGAWSEYNITVPFIQLKEAGVESIDGLSVIMSNPTTKIDGNYEPVLTQKENKEISKVNAVYSFYLKLNK